MCTCTHWTQDPGHWHTYMYMWWKLHKEVLLIVHSSCPTSCTQQLWMQPFLHKSLKSFPHSEHYMCCLIVLANLECQWSMHRGCYCWVQWTVHQSTLVHMHQSLAQQRLLVVAGYLQEFQNIPQKWHDSSWLCTHCFSNFLHTFAYCSASMACCILPLVLGHDCQTHFHSSTHIHIVDQNRSTLYNTTGNFQYFPVPHHGWRGLIGLCALVLTDPQNIPCIHRCSKLESMPEYCCLRCTQMIYPSMSQPFFL